MYFCVDVLIVKFGWNAFHQILLYVSHIASWYIFATDWYMAVIHDLNFTGIDLLKSGILLLEITQYLLIVWLAIKIITINMITINEMFCWATFAL